MANNPFLFGSIIPNKTAQIMGASSDLKPVMRTKNNSSLEIIQIENKYALCRLGIIPALRSCLCYIFKTIFYVYKCTISPMLTAYYGCVMSWYSDFRFFISVITPNPYKTISSAPPPISHLPYYEKYWLYHFRYIERASTSAGSSSKQSELQMSINGEPPRAF